MTYSKWILAAAILLVSAGAFGQDSTGQILLKYCATEERQMDGASLTADEQTNAVLCIGYITGSREAFDLFPPKNANGKPFLCYPTHEVNNAQLIRVVTKWMRDHPERLNEPRIGMVFLAIRDAWPCKQ